MSETERILAPGGLFVQFTYALLGEMPFVPKSFRKVRSKIVLRNMPPAKVEVFRKPKARACGLDAAPGNKSTLS
jgi:phospholipid N-methyltransferase